MASPLLVSFFLGKEARLAAFRPFALSHFRGAGVAVCGDAVHAPHEAFSTVVPSMGPEWSSTPEARFTLRDDCVHRLNLGPKLI